MSARPCPFYESSRCPTCSPAERFIRRVCETELHPYTKLVGMMLGHHAVGRELGEETGWPTVQRLAADCSLSARRVGDALDELARAGLLPQGRA